MAQRKSTSPKTAPETPKNKPGGVSYRQAGVNIDEADRAVASIRGMARSTFTPAVLTDIGSFGGGYRLQGYRDPVLV